MLNRYGKLLLGAFILKMLSSGNSHKVSEVSEKKNNGIVSKYGKLMLSAYLMKRLRPGKQSGTREQEEDKGGVLSKYGKMMLTTYAIKRLRPGKSHEKKEQSEQHMVLSTGGSLINAGSFLAHTAMKYGKWFLSGYLLKKIYRRKSRDETKEAVEIEKYEEKGSSMFKFSTLAVGALAGVAAVYAVKRYRTKHNGYRIEVE